MSTTISPPLKWFGGKGSHQGKLAKWIVSLMPQHLHYVEPFFGGGAVLLARNPDDDAEASLYEGRGVSEVVNDINGRLINFWRVLQDVATFTRFQRAVESVPLARAEWERAHKHDHGVADPVANAVAFFIDCRQSHAGNMKGFTAATRTRTRRRMNGNVSEWLTAVDGLPAVHARLRRVLVENLPALDVIRREDTTETLFYADPPYVHLTRATKKGYAFEMTEADHHELLDVLRGVKGKVILSGYASELYDHKLHDWSRHAFEVPNNAAGGRKKRRMTEVVWSNF